MTRSKSKSNRFKKNKTKRYRQTKNKRRRQHGGEVKKYPYTRDSATILKPESVSDPVLIPGYSEIMDMMQEYSSNGSNDTEESRKLKIGIKEKDVQLIRECLPTTSIEEGKIIVLRKEDKKFVSFLLKNSSIKCDPSQYYDLASHNFKIFIKDILGWNPFLNLPNIPKEIETNQLYGSRPHVYKSEPVFKTNSWWTTQPWWNSYNSTSDFIGKVEEAVSKKASDDTSIFAISSEISHLKSEIDTYKEKIKVNELKIKTLLIQKDNIQSRIFTPEGPE